MNALANRVPARVLPVAAPFIILALLLLLVPRNTPPVVTPNRPPVPPAPATATATAPTTAPADSPHIQRDAAGNLVWPRPRFTERQSERDAMVSTQIAGGAGRDTVTDARVLDAMRSVPRHEFVPDDQRTAAYADGPLSIGHGQTISQPYMVALMTELLAVQPGHRILEIGTGSGYQAAVLAELTPYVYSIEIVAPLADQARTRLEHLGYKTVQVRAGDGYQGWPEHAPFDGVIVTCAPDNVPTPLWDQLKPGGRMVIPLGEAGAVQRLVVLTKRPDGTRHTREVTLVRFVPMTGEGKRGKQ
jgi:protein-L-isoaspartate(D-aspartate) O-methyltransferase